MKKDVEQIRLVSLNKKALKPHNYWLQETSEGNSMVSEKVVTVIPKKENLTESGKKPVTRVAAYVRVSSASDAQEESFDSQVAHFEEYIGNHPGWEMVKIYQDEGISGMNIKKRKGFKQMLADGKRGRFDKVLVKSISRWGRNTVDSLEAIRMLQDCNIGAVFEKEALDTSQPGSEFILTIMASLAQAESMSISQNVQIGYQYKMARGEHTLAYSQFLGYDKGEDGKLVVNPEQAKTVKLIYTEFLKGLSLQDVSKKLMAEGHLTGKGNSVWGKSALSRIIRAWHYLARRSRSTCWRRSGSETRARVSSISWRTTTNRSWICRPSLLHKVSLQGGTRARWARFQDPRSSRSETTLQPLSDALYAERITIISVQRR